MECKYQIVVKATNTNTNQVIYEGVKKEYNSYHEAAVKLKQAAQGIYPRSWNGNPPTSYRITEWYREDLSSYVTWRHWSSVRITAYIKMVEVEK